jgi:hypothetical protein
MPPAHHRSRFDHGDLNHIKVILLTGFEARDETIQWSFLATGSAIPPASLRVSFPRPDGQ